MDGCRRLVIFSRSSSPAAVLRRERVASRLDRIDWLIFLHFARRVKIADDQLGVKYILARVKVSSGRLFKLRDLTTFICETDSTPEHKFHTRNSTTCRNISWTQK